MTLSTNRKARNLYYHYLIYSLTKNLGTFPWFPCQLVAADWLQELFADGLYFPEKAAGVQLKTFLTQTNFLIT